MSAQRNLTNEVRKVKYGVNAGLNLTKLNFKEDQVLSSAESEALGFRFGVLAEYYLSHRVCFSPKAELAFYQNELFIVNSDGVGIQYAVMPIAYELKAHFNYALSASKQELYLFIGPSYSKSLWYGSKESEEIGTKSTLAVDVGIGYEKKLNSFFFAPELRYSHGLQDVNKSSEMKSIYLHNISLLVNFKG